MPFRLSNLSFLTTPRVSLLLIQIACIFLAIRDRRRAAKKLAEIETERIRTHNHLARLIKTGNTLLNNEERLLKKMLADTGVLSDEVIDEAVVKFFTEVVPELDLDIDDPGFEVDVESSGEDSNNDDDEDRGL